MESRICVIGEHSPLAPVFCAKRKIEGDGGNGMVRRCFLTEALRQI